MWINKTVSAGLLVLMGCASDPAVLWTGPVDDASLCEADLLPPIEIEHKVEDLYFGDALQQRYNYLLYHFERNGNYISARAYLDEANKVAIYGPYESKVTRVKTTDDDFQVLVVAYLKRRFSKIDTLNEGAGYQTLWEHKLDDKPSLELCDRAYQP
ncbi:MAG: hypothetical protein DHS20C05_22670 [Hyphococcus sp.]|nr:MAG: hypothetical protein DHS20C05_22670 [Marinicaulis sp.]